MEEINETVLEQLEEIRDSGQCNMLNTQAVRRIARNERFNETAEIIGSRDNQRYVQHLKEMGKRV